MVCFIIFTSRSLQGQGWWVSFPFQSSQWWSHFFRWRIQTESLSDESHWIHQEKCGRCRGRRPDV